MLNSSRICRVASALRAVLLAWLSLGAVAHADVLLDDTRILGAAPAAVEHEFGLSASGDIEITLTDFATPAAFTNLRLALTRADTLVTSLSAPGAVTVNAGVGTYVLRVVGDPGGTAGVGTFGVCVTRLSDPAPRACIAEFAAPIQDAGAPSATNVSTLDTEIVIADAGDYTVDLVDHGFPTGLTSVSAALFLGSAPAASNSVGITPGSVVLQNLVAGTYRLLIAAEANGAEAGGLYGIRLRGGPSNAVVFERSVPVGALGPAVTFTNPAAQNLTLNLTDLGFPAPLTGLAVAITRGYQRQAALTAPGSAPAFSASTGSYQVWTLASAGVTPGAYGIAVSGGSGVVYEKVAGVGAGTPGATPAFAFPVQIATAGTYQARVADFQFPSTLPAVQFAIVQNGTVLDSTTAAGIIAFTAVPGTVTLLVTAQPPSGGSGLLGVEVLDSATSPATLFETTQAVGSQFATHEFVVTTSGGYDVSLKDLGFIANFQSLALAVTRGSQLIGSIFGGGSFRVPTTPGRYLVTFIATPAVSGYGLYSIRVASSQPTLTFTASAPSVTEGGFVTLAWEASDSATCTASGGWSGARAGVGNEASGTLNADTTFTLDCAGPGGTISKSVSVDVTPKPASSGGGGGDFGILGLAAIALLSVLRRRAAV